MRTKIYFLISIILIILFIDKFFHTQSIEVIGKAIRTTNDQSLIYSGRYKTLPIKGVKILAVQGKVIAFENRVTIPIKDIKHPIFYSKTNDNGVFILNIPPGIYTFFMMLNDKAYLNNFDGKGNFSSMKINSRKDDLVLTDYRDSLF